MSSPVVTVNYATADGTTTAGSDYTSTSGSHFNAGDTTDSIFPILANLLMRKMRHLPHFIICLKCSSKRILWNGTMTITDDIAPTVSINDVTASEGAGAANLTASLSVASGRTIT